MQKPYQRNTAQSSNEQVSTKGVLCAQCCDKSQFMAANINMDRALAAAQQLAI